MTFAELNLHADIFKAIQACGYTIPTPIQARSIPEIMKGKDLVASAQTGTGKTASFVLPALHLLSQTKGTGAARILVLSPTRELASQITLAASKYGKFMRFNIASAVGGSPYRQQLREVINRPLDMLVATPGRLLDLMKNHRLDLSKVEMLILDEADRMLDMGFIDDVREISKATPATRQTLLFSATVDDKLSGVIRQLMKEPVRVNLSEAIMAPKLIKQEAYIADNNQHKERLLMHMLTNNNIYKAIIFSGTKINADYLTRRLRDMDFAAAALHGDLKQNVRTKTVEQLRRGKVQFLVATDVAARGIDINDVTHVINYDLPKFSEDYVHRIGRTGRAGKSGIAISLVLPVDARHLQKIEKFIGEKITFATIEGLEPTKRLNNAAADAAGSKRKFGGKGSFSRGGNGGGKSFGGGYKGKSSESRGYESRVAAKSGEGKNRYENSGDRREKSYAPRGESRGEGRSFAPRGESRSEGRSFAPRGESRGEGRERSFAPRSESRGEGREKSYAPRGESRSEGRSFAPRSESRGEGKERSFTPRPDSRGEGREKSFAPRGESRGEGRSFAPRSEKSYAPRGESRGEGRSFAPRSEGRRDSKSDNGGRSSYAKRSEQGSEGRSYVRKSEGRGDFKSAPVKTFSANPESKSKDPRVSYAKSSNPAGRRTNDKRGNFSRDAFGGAKRSKPSEV
jgi:superfamily II DNA/RNA helicase